MRLIFTPIQIKMRDKFFELGRCEVVTQVIQKPDCGNVFRMYSGPVHRYLFMGADMVRPWEISLLLVDEQIPFVIQSIYAVPA